MSTSARNQPQPASPKAAAYQRNRRLAATLRNRLRRNGKEGVNGSSPLEGFKEGQQMAFLLSQRRTPIARSSLKPVPRSVPNISGTLKSWLEQEALAFIEHLLGIANHVLPQRATRRLIQ
jgi:hypothetical protein